MRFLVLLIGAWLMAGVALAQSAPPSEVESAFAAARAASPLPVTLDRQHADWLADRARDPESAADTDESWRETWTRSAARDTRAAATRVALGALSDGCVKFGLLGCTAPVGGWLNAPEGGGRLYWQVQNGATEETGVTAGVVLLAIRDDGDLAPVAWTFEGAVFETPVIFQFGDDLYVAAAGITAGTGAYNADVIFRWSPGADRPLTQIDNESWRDETLPTMLQAGLEVWKGVSFSYGSLTARTSLWRQGDGNCCPTGGEAFLDFQIEGDVLKLVSVTPDDDVIDFVMTTPTEVMDWMSRSLMCDHWGGEEGYDADRRAQIEQAATELRCDALAADRLALEAKYADRPRALDGLARADPGPPD